MKLIASVWSALALVLALHAAPVLAVTPDEILPDPALEARARVISKDLRCLVCRNENIDDSNADLAKDLRILVRERLVEGDSNEEVIAYVVDRYGEYVLLRPGMSGSNLALWLAGPVMGLVAVAGVWLWLRRRSVQVAAAEAPLSEEEEARLRALLGQGDGPKT